MRRQRRRQQISLQRFGAPLCEQLRRADGLDTFSNHGQPHPVCEFDRGSDNERITYRLLEIGDEGTVNLQHADWQPFQLRK